MLKEGNMVCFPIVVAHESTFFFSDVTEGAVLTGSFDIPRECSHVMASSLCIYL